MVTKYFEILHVHFFMQITWENISFVFKFGQLP